MNLHDYVTERERRDPAFRAAREELGPEYESRRALIEARLAAGLTQAELAAKVATTQSAIARLESGEVTPKIDTLSTPMLIPAPLPSALPKATLVDVMGLSYKEANDRIVFVGPIIPRVKIGTTTTSSSMRFLSSTGTTRAGRGRWGSVGWPGV
jgi:hypothetical protein